MIATIVEWLSVSIEVIQHALIVVSETIRIYIHLYNHWNILESMCVWHTCLGHVLSVFLVLDVELYHRGQQYILVQPNPETTHYFEYNFPKFFK